jgi:hypothetical protein
MRASEAEVGPWVSSPMNSPRMSSVPASFALHSDQGRGNARSMPQQGRTMTGPAPALARRCLGLASNHPRTTWLRSDQQAPGSRRASLMRRFLSAYPGCSAVATRGSKTSSLWPLSARARLAESASAAPWSARATAPPFWPSGAPEFGVQSLSAPLRIYTAEAGAERSRLSCEPRTSNCPARLGLLA